MAVDDITKGHLARQRVRGAPSTIPGVSGFVGEYTAGEVLRQAQRALVVKLEGEITPDKLRDAFEQLAAAAREQRLTVTGDPLYLVKGDPMEVVPNKREHEACLPVRGEAKEQGAIKPMRLEGGLHIACTTTAGLDDLENLYTWLFGKFLPARKHELMRPCILHRFVSGLGPGETATIEVLAPATLSIKSAKPSGDGGAAA